MGLPGFRVRHEFEGESVCVMAKGHPLAALESVSTRDLDDVPLVLLWGRSQLRHEVDMVFRRAHITPQIVAEVHSIGVACSMASRGIGVTIVNRLLANCCDTESFTMRPFHPVIRFSSGIASLDAEPLSPTCVALAEELAEALQHPFSLRVSGTSADGETVPASR
jgi:DNA-binding transcriptional LysR family regulator